MTAATPAALAPAPAFRGGMIVVMTDAVGRGGKRYKLERQVADTFAMRDESGSTKAKRYTGAELTKLREEGKLTIEAGALAAVGVQP